MTQIETSNSSATLAATPNHKLWKWPEHLCWGRTFVSWRLYVRNPVPLPGFIPKRAPKKVRQILDTLYAAELASLNNPRLLTRVIMVAGWTIITAIACVVNFRRHRPAIRRDLPDLGDLGHLRRLLVSAFLNNIAPGEFYLMKFYIGRYYADRRGHLLRWQGNTLMTHALPSDGSRKIADKHHFWQTLSSAGIPTVPVWALVKDGQWIEGNWAEIAAAGRDLVVKPTTLSLGTGISFLDAQPDGEWISQRKRLTADATRQYIETHAQSHTVIIQPRLDNHPSMAVFGTKGLVTIRMVTMKTQDMASPVCFSAALRIPGVNSRLAKGAGRSNNPTTDTLISAIDLNTGILGHAVGTAPAAENLTIHPSTQAPIAGKTLPHWDECKNLCLRSHALVPSINSAGWDVVLTPDGPLMLEVNLRWGTRVLQLSQRIPLLHTAFVDHYEAITSPLQSPGE